MQKIRSAQTEGLPADRRLCEILEKPVLLLEKYGNAPTMRTSLFASLLPTLKLDIPWTTGLVK